TTWLTTISGAFNDPLTTTIDAQPDLTRNPTAESVIRLPPMFAGQLISLNADLSHALVAALLLLMRSTALRTQNSELRTSAWVAADGFNLCGLILLLYYFCARRSLNGLAAESVDNNAQHQTVPGGSDEENHRVAGLYDCSFPCILRDETLSGGVQA